MTATILPSCMHTSGSLQRRPLRLPGSTIHGRRLQRQLHGHNSRLHGLKNEKKLDIAFIQRPDEALFLVPTEQDVEKSDLSIQFLPSRLNVTVKGETLLSGDLPEDVDIDGCFWHFEYSPEGDKKLIMLTLAKKEVGGGDWPWPIENEDPFGDAGPEQNNRSAPMTHFTYFDITADGAPLGRIIFGLHGNQLPRTVENFRALCAGDRGISKTGVPLHYKGSPFHRIIPGFMAQGGDFTQGNGTGGVSVYGGQFNDEGFPIKHTHTGQLSMANSGPNTNGSQFFIIFGPQPHLDGKHTVFGEIYSGFSVLKQLAKLGSQSGSVSKAIVIADCGHLTGEDSPLRTVNK